MATIGTISNSDSPRHIVITGASGYLGQHLIVHLAKILPLIIDEGEEASYHVTCLYNTTKGFDPAIKKLNNSSSDCKLTLEAIPLDITDESKVRAWFNSHNTSTDTVVIHSAALSSPRACEEDHERAERINVPKAFLDCCLASPWVKLFIGLSTDQVYDGTSPPYTTSTTRNGLNQYAKTKVALEDYVREQSSTTTRIIFLRSSILLGPKAPLEASAHDTFLHFCASRVNQETAYFINERRSVLSVSDACRTIAYFVTQQGKKSSSTYDDNTYVVYNMGGPRGVSRFEMAAAVATHQPNLILKSEVKVPADHAIPSPMDITMDSTPLYEETGLTFASLDAIVVLTFGGDDDD